MIEVHFWLQAGCTIRTGCEVQYVVRNEDEGSQRRWLVFVNDFDYIETDIVVLSGSYALNITLLILFLKKTVSYNTLFRLQLEFSVRRKYFFNPS